MFSSGLNQHAGFGGRYTSPKRKRVTPLACASRLCAAESRNEFRIALSRRLQLCPAYRYAARNRDSNSAVLELGAPVTISISLGEDPSSLKKDAMASVIILKSSGGNRIRPPAHR